MIKRYVKERVIPFFANAQLSKIYKFKNLHKGEACYLFGDGPSVKYFDLKQFSDKISIPCSYLPFHRDFNLLNAPYAFLFEPFWFYPFQHCNIPDVWVRNRIQALYHQKIEEYKDKQFFINLSNYPTIRQKNVTFVYDNWFSEEIKNHLGLNLKNPFNSSLYGTLTLAVYMGFEKIIMVGFDYHTEYGGTGHWYEAKNEFNGTPDPNYQKDFFDEIGSYADFEMITLKGKGIPFSSKTYSDYFGVEPNYQSNQELLDLNTLKILSYWPKYNIF